MIVYDCFSSYNYFRTPGMGYMGSISIISYSIYKSIFISRVKKKSNEKDHVWECSCETNLKVMQRSDNYSWLPAPWRWVLFDPLNALKSQAHRKQLRNFTQKSSFMDSLGNFSLWLWACVLSCQGGGLLSLVHVSLYCVCFLVFIPCLVPVGISFCGHHICISKKYMVLR